MATAAQITRVRIQISDTSPSHYAFTDTEIGVIYDEEGTILRTAISLYRILLGSPPRLANLMQVDISDAYSVDVVRRTLSDQIALLESAVLVEEEDDSQYEEDDDRWTWEWSDHLEDMLNRN